VTFKVAQPCWLRRHITTSGRCNNRTGRREELGTDRTFLDFRLLFQLVIRLARNRLSVRAALGERLLALSTGSPESVLVGGTGQRGQSARGLPSQVAPTNWREPAPPVCCMGNCIGNLCSLLNRWPTTYYDGASDEKASRIRTQPGHRIGNFLRRPHPSGWAALRLESKTIPPGQSSPSPNRAR
jgi:hypothetical protein